MEPSQLRPDLRPCARRLRRVPLAAHRLSPLSAGTVTIIDFSVRGWIATQSDMRDKGNDGLDIGLVGSMPRAIG